MDDYRLTQIADLNKKIEETRVLLSEPEMAEMAQMEIADLESQKKQLEDSLAASDTSEEDDLDDRNVIFEIKGATGGDEAKLWGEDLTRMYIKFAQRKGFKVEQVDDAVYKISGRNAFGIFKYEAGVHRVQRTPATEKRGGIHTSTATVSILPELEDIDMHRNPEDVEFEAFRSGSHSGQKVNKGSNSVRLTNKPTGIIVTIYTQRFQGKNTEITIDMLRATI